MRLVQHPGVEHPREDPRRFRVTADDMIVEVDEPEWDKDGAMYPASGAFAHPHARNQREPGEARTAYLPFFPAAPPVEVGRGTDTDGRRGVSKVWPPERKTPLPEPLLGCGCCAPPERPLNIRRWLLIGSLPY